MVEVSLPEDRDTPDPVDVDFADLAHRDDWDVDCVYVEPARALVARELERLRQIMLSRPARDMLYPDDVAARIEQLGGVREELGRG